MHQARLFQLKNNSQKCGAGGTNYITVPPGPNSRGDASPLSPPVIYATGHIDDLASVPLGVPSFLSISFGVAHSLHMPALRPASQAGAGPMRNPSEGTSVCSVARHHQANLMVCVVCSCCATSPYREVCRAKGGIGSGETCAMIFTLLGL